MGEREERREAGGNSHAARISIRLQRHPRGASRHPRPHPGRTKTLDDPALCRSRRPVPDTGLSAPARQLDGCWKVRGCGETDEDGVLIIFICDFNVSVFTQPI